MNLNVVLVNPNWIKTQVDIIFCFSKTLCSSNIFSELVKLIQNIWEEALLFLLPWYAYYDIIAFIGTSFAEAISWKHLFLILRPSDEKTKYFLSLIWMMSVSSFQFSLCYHFLPFSKSSTNELNYLSRLKNMGLQGY